MAIWYETKEFFVYYGWESESKKIHTYYNSSYKKLKEELRTLLDEINTLQYKVLSIMPLTEGYSQQNLNSAQGGWAYGYGLGLNTGFIVFAQREIEVSEEEFQRRKKAIQLSDQFHFLKAEEIRLQALLEATQKKKNEALNEAESLEAQHFETLPIEEKKKLLGGMQFVINKEKFDSRELAENYRSQQLTKLQNIKSDIIKYEVETEEITKEIEINNENLLNNTTAREMH